MTPESPAHGLVNQMVGNYRVEKLVGQGAMGTVFRAVHPEIGRVVAIKVLAPHLAVHEELAARFVDEARAVSRIEHPNIIEVFDFGRTAGGQLYFTMEWLEGADLAQLLDEQAPMSLDQVRGLLRPIASALDAAHQAGIVHRDLKPENIFIARKGGEQVVKVLDFGVAKLMDEPTVGSRKTAAGVILGTPLYMSPEQAAGQHEMLGPASDIYALGVILYEMLSGSLPIDGPTSALVLAGHITSLPVPLGEVAAGLPEPIYRLVDRALAKAPADRPPSAMAVWAAFDAAVTAAAGDRRATTKPGPRAARARSWHETSAEPPPGRATTHRRATGEISKVLAERPGLIRPRWSRWLALATVAVAAALSVAVFLWRRNASEGGSPGRGAASSRHAKEARDAPRRGATADEGPGQAAARTDRRLTAPLAPVSADGGAGVIVPPSRGREPARTRLAGASVHSIRIRAQSTDTVVRVRIGSAAAGTRVPPFTLQVRHGVPVELYATAPGHQPRTLSFTALGDRDLLVRLPNNDVVGMSSLPPPAATTSGQRRIPPRRHPAGPDLDVGTLKPML